MSDATVPATARPRRLGEQLVDRELITPTQLSEALARQAQTGELVGEALVGLGHLSEDTLVQILCDANGIPYVPPAELRAEPSALRLIPASLARAHEALPIRQEDRSLVVAFGDPFDVAAVTAIERAVGMPVKVLGTAREAVALRVSESYAGDRTSLAVDAAPEPVAPTLPASRPAGRSTPALRPPGRPRVAAGLKEAVSEESGSAAQVCDEIIRRGIAIGATDIHVEPQPEATRIRYRLDGLLQDAASYPQGIHQALMSRFKILASLNIAETRLPQDGRFRFRAEGREVDLRISTFPTLHGEDVVLRILDRGRVALNLDDLGIAPADVELFRTALDRPHGLIAVTGPTGSGKTTTLYSGLTELNRGERCILTLEDPIEYELEGVRQAQVNVKAGLTFGNGLRSMLRHDPDVILVGEMRDRETVEIALSAALTGHLVLTTLHTNTAAGAIPRLLDMGAEAFLLASAIHLVASQRLVRKLCRECRSVTHVADGVRERYGLEDVRLYEPRGCAVCRYTGFRGRIGIFEIMPVTERVTTAMMTGCTEEDLRRISQRPTLLDDGLTKVRAGVTSLDELLRVIAV